MTNSLIFPNKVRIVGVTNPIIMYNSSKVAKAAYDSAVETMESDADQMTRETALELALLSKYSQFVILNLSDKISFTKLMNKDKFFAEWVDCNLEKIPDNLKVFAVKQYCKGLKLTASRKYILTLEPSLVSEETEEEEEFEDDLDDLDGYTDED